MFSLLLPLAEWSSGKVCAKKNTPKIITRERSSPSLYSRVKDRSDQKTRLKGSYVRGMCGRAVPQSSSTVHSYMNLEVSRGNAKPIGKSYLGYHNTYKKVYQSLTPHGRVIVNLIFSSFHSLIVTHENTRFLWHPSKYEGGSYPYGLMRSCEKKGRAWNRHEAQHIILQILFQHYFHSDFTLVLIFSISCIKIQGIIKNSSSDDGYTTLFLVCQVSLSLCVQHFVPIILHTNFHRSATGCTTGGLLKKKEVSKSWVCLRVY